MDNLKDERVVEEKLNDQSDVRRKIKRKRSSKSLTL